MIDGNRSVNIRQFIATLLVVIFTLTPLVATANKITTVTEGQKVPFSGHLLDTEALLRLRNGKLLAEKLCALERRFDASKAKAEKNYQLSICKNDLNATEKKLYAIINVKDREIKDLRNIALKRNNPNLIPLWIAVGVVVGVGLTIGVAFAVKPIVQQ